METEGWAVVAASAGEVMSDEAVDRLLLCLAEATERLLADQAEALRLMRHISDARDRRRPGPAGEAGTPGDVREGLVDVGQGARDGGEAVAGGALRIDPREAMSALQEMLAEQVANDLEDAAGLFVAWWADVAVCAVVAELTGTGLTAVRAAAGDPYLHMDDDRLALLPAVPEQDRQLAELALRMDEGMSSFGGYGGLAPVGGRDFAAELGLIVRVGANGEQVLADGGSSESRRRRLWGRMWLDLQIPRLPETAELVEALRDAGASSATVEAVSEAASSVDAAVAAKIRARELEDRLEKMQQTAFRLGNPGRSADSQEPGRPMNSWEPGGPMDSGKPERLGDSGEYARPREFGEPGRPEVAGQAREPGRPGETKGPGEFGELRESDDFAELDAEVGALWKDAERLTRLLAAYALTLTTHLPALRLARRAS
ncbi:hypothetical protein DQ384_05955 [Sphaerisporangium album]|uniref:Uncharacterized protein n=1 Tax=Sphaerisporangium album TaxID=509200 RepID=A0A367FQS6_9ACTN|nr:hypothetical protein [Sphaerisporangium album]RCG32067.1 hypothetical protein DQ384_05955 [Sphaerisporangium album]